MILILKDDNTILYRIKVSNLNSLSLHLYANALLFTETVISETITVMIFRSIYITTIYIMFDYTLVFVFDRQQPKIYTAIRIFIIKKT